jgi:hypothetical protein
MCVRGTFQRILNVPKTKPLYAYREWGVDERGHLCPRHVPISFPDTWKTGSAKAHKRPTSPKAAKYSPDHGLHFNKKRMARGDRSSDSIYGRCAIYGRVAVYGEGYLAERAHVVSIAGHTKQARAIAKSLRVRVTK